MSANKYKTNHERMLELIEKLNEADIAYYRDDNPIMSDRDYDILMDELKGLERIRDWCSRILRRRKCPERFWRN